MLLGNPDVLHGLGDELEKLGRGAVLRTLAMGALKGLKARSSGLGEAAKKKMTTAAESRAAQIGVPAGAFGAGLYLGSPSKPKPPKRKPRRQLPMYDPDTMEGPVGGGYGEF